MNAPTTTAAAQANPLTGEIPAPAAPNAELTDLEALLMRPRTLQAPPTDFSPKTLDEALDLAKMLADSDFVPKDYQKKPANCFVAIQWGAELGLKPMQSIQNIAVINNRPSLWGDAQLALVRQSPHCEYVLEDWDADGTAFCRAKRRGEPEQVRTFSIEDQKTAGLAGKQGPHTQYPKRMRQLRARGFALRDVFTDVLRGIPQAEELLTLAQQQPTDVGQLPRNAPPAAVGAAAAAQRPARTEAHDKMIADFELLAYNEGSAAFQVEWKKLPKEDRAAIGIAERDRINAIGIETDQHAADGAAGAEHADASA